MNECSENKIVKMYYYIAIENFKNFSYFYIIFLN